MNQKLPKFYMMMRQKENRWETVFDLLKNPTFQQLQDELIYTDKMIEEWKRFAQHAGINDDVGNWGELYEQAVYELDKLEKQRSEIAGMIDTVMQIKIKEFKRLCTKYGNLAEHEETPTCTYNTKNYKFPATDELVLAEIIGASLNSS